MRAFGIAFFAQRDPDALALCESSGRTWTRGELSSAVNQIAHGLLQSGLRGGDVIAIVAPNCIEFVAVYLAATDIGLYVVPVNWHLSPPELSYILENSGAKAVVAHNRMAAQLARVLQLSRPPQVEQYISIGEIAGFRRLEDLRERQPEQRVSDPIQGRVMMFTSATTGRPKTINVPIHGAAEGIARTIEFHVSTGIALEDGNVHLCASMLYHAAPLEFVVIALLMGHQVVLTSDRWDPEQTLALIERYHVTTTFMVPSMFVRLLKLPRTTRLGYDTTSLKLVSHSAAPCPVEVKRQIIDWWGPIIWEGYGAAEGQGTFVSSTEWLQRPGTVGRPIPGTVIKILDDQGNELRHGEVGTIYLSRYTGDRFEYRNDPEKTRAAYRGDVFTVGDVGYMDDAGYLYLCDRKVDMVICGGMNVYPAEIEQVLVQHPSVFDCAVFGIPDELMGEALRAVVQLMPTVVADNMLTADIYSFMRKYLSAVKMPRQIDYTHELPRDPNGKLFKRALRDPFWNGFNRKI